MSHERILTTEEWIKRNALPSDLEKIPPRVQRGQWEEACARGDDMAKQILTMSFRAKGLSPYLCGYLAYRTGDWAKYRTLLDDIREEWTLRELEAANGLGIDYVWVDEVQTDAEKRAEAAEIRRQFKEQWNDLLRDGYTLMGAAAAAGLEDGDAKGATISPEWIPPSFDTISLWDKTIAQLREMVPAAIRKRLDMEEAAKRGARAGAKDGVADILPKVYRKAMNSDYPDPLVPKKRKSGGGRPRKYSDTQLKKCVEEIVRKHRDGGSLNQYAIEAKYFHRQFDQGDKNPYPTTKSFRQAVKNELEKILPTDKSQPPPPKPTA